MNRRRFLRTSSLATTAAAALAAVPSRTLLALQADNSYRRNIGIQLYTLRKEIGADTAGTIKAVVDAGYKQGEMYGFPNCDAMISAAKDSGLALHSSHFDWACVTKPSDDDLSDFRKILDKAKEVGLSHLVVPYLHDHERGGADAYRKLAENFNKAAAISKEAGIQLSYHNHSFEFQTKGDEPSGFQVFIDEFSPDMQFEVDVFWIKAAGIEPVDMINKLIGRISQLHLKDLKGGMTLPIYNGMPKDGFEELGDGIIPMEPIIVAGRAAGVAHCHVEQDQSPDALASIRQSFNYLKTL